MTEMIGEDQVNLLLQKALRDAERGRGTGQISEGALKEVEAALVRYQRIVEESSLAVNTKNTYRLHAGNFTKWLGGKFVPGGRKDSR